MGNDVLLKREGLEALNDRLGPVGMERFIVLMTRELCDYTEWHETLLDDLSVRELSKKAMDCQRPPREKT